MQKQITWTEKINIKRLLAFSLAEVLVVLVIIGIVATLCLPSIMASYQKEVTVDRLKKVYSTLNQAVERAEVDNGPIDNWDMGDNPLGYGDEAKSIEFAKNYLAPYLNVAKNCGSDMGCLPPVPATRYLDLNNNWHSFMGDDGHLNKMRLNDGTIIASLCATDRTLVFVDINGYQGPNMAGKDVFKFYISKGSRKLAEDGVTRTSAIEKKSKKRTLPEPQCW